jgi:hypothetical protein
MVDYHAVTRLMGIMQATYQYAANPAFKCRFAVLSPTMLGF